MKRKNNGKMISRTEAVCLSNNIMENAENGRLDVTKKEACGQKQLPIDAGTVLYEFLLALSGEIYSSETMYFVFDGVRRRLLLKGYDSEDVDKTVKILAAVLSSRRTSGMQEFMG